MINVQRLAIAQQATVQDLAVDGTDLHPAIGGHTQLQATPLDGCRLLDGSDHLSLCIRNQGRFPRRLRRIRNRLGRERVWQL